MGGPFPGVPDRFGAWRQTCGLLFVRYDVCRRYAPLYLAEIRDTDYARKLLAAAGAAPMERWPSQSRIGKPP
jgi:hypothetical protein